MLKLYNDLIKKKEKFEPLEKDKVKIYVCGPTVYDSPHVGHARAAVSFDLLRRYLLFNKKKVVFASNYTDVDDKMIERANEMEVEVHELAAKYIKEYEDVMKKLNVLRPDIIPTATGSINAIQKLIKLIIDKGYAYESNGSVYFDVEKFAENSDYDTLFMRKLIKKEDDEEQNTAVEFLEDKKNERDFALWKKEKPFEPNWDSPWGKGRPGWHIECSAMVNQHLGKEIDIHGGGKDLIFPHHTNEIAQTEAALGTKLARYWLHNGFVNINNEKMSKSLKNFFTADEVIKEYGGNTLRFFLSSVNYRKPINYTIENLDDAKSNLSKIIEFYGTMKSISTAIIDETELKDITKNIKEIERKFFESLDDDLNTAESLSQIYRLVRYFNTILFEEKKEISEDIKKCVLELMMDFSNIFGIILDDKIQHLGEWGMKDSGLMEIVEEKENIISNLMDLLISIRVDLRKNKHYDLSDKIRDSLKELGIELSDMKGKTMWKYSSDDI